MLNIRSKEALALLNYFFLHETEKLYINEMVRQFGVDKRNLVKKLAQYAAEGLLLSERKGKEVYYSLNRKYPLYNEYKKIVLQTTGIESQLKSVLKGIKGVEEAYIFGSYARNKLAAHSDVDVFVIGDADTVTLQKRLAGLQAKYNREINLVNYGREEFEKKLKDGDSFAKSLKNGERIKLL